MFLVCQCLFCEFARLFVERLRPLSIHGIRPFAPHSRDDLARGPTEALACLKEHSEMQPRCFEVRICMFGDPVDRLFTFLRPQHLISQLSQMERLHGGSRMIPDVIADVSGHTGEQGWRCRQLCDERPGRIVSLIYLCFVQSQCALILVRSTTGRTTRCEEVLVVPQWLALGAARNVHDGCQKGKFFFYIQFV